MPVDERMIKAVFFAALEQATAAERSAYLDGACAGDAELRREVDLLLRAHDQPDSLLDQPVGRFLTGEDAAGLDFLEPSAKAGSIGRLGHYEVLEVVGRGGMGMVVRAFDEKLHRVVAIKVLAPVLAASGSSRQRFVREARATAAVTHDNVVAIYAVEDTGPVPYLVMQFVDGCTLQQKLDRSGPLPVKEILRLGIGIADGLEAAHRHGLVHRDVKPANILLENGVERVKITDFGLARAVDDASLTRSGIIAGTPAYMSPEQADGDRVDPRSDLFSLGSVLYALCTGHAPFRAGTTMAVLRRVCDDTPRPIREINPEIPGWLVSVIARLQAKEPGQRYSTAKEVASLLSQRLAQLQTGADDSNADVPAPRPAETRARPGRKWLTPGKLSAAIVFVGIALLAWLSRDSWLLIPASTEAGQSAARPESWKPRPAPTADELAKRVDPLDAWSLGRLAAASGRTAKDVEARLRQQAGMAAASVGTNAAPELVGLLGDGPFRLPMQEQTHWPTQAPDGSVLALPCGNMVVLYDAGTGAFLRLLKGHTHRTFHGDFSSDSKRFACGSVDGFIRIWDVSTGKEELSFQDGTNNVWCTRFSPDGKQIVTGGVEGAVKVWEASTGKSLKTLGVHEAGATCLAFNSTGTRLVSTGVDHEVRVWLWPGGELLKTLEGHPDIIQSVAFSADGTLLASGSQARVMVWDVANLRARFTLQTPGGGVLGFTPDGRTLVAGPHDLPEGRKRSFTRWDLQTGTLSATRDVPGPRHPVAGLLSRDGRTVYLMSYAPPDAALGAYDAVTGADRFLDQGHAGPVSCVGFSPDGLTLASGGQDGRVLLWELANPSSNPPAAPRRLAGHDQQVFAVTFSPDGRLLATSSVDGTIRLLEVETGRIVHELGLGQAPMPIPLAFSPDGETLGAGGGSGSINLWDVKTGQPMAPVRWHVGFVYAVAFSPDGRWLASGGQDKTVQLIDRATGLRAQTFRGGALVTCLAFSPDSGSLAAALGGTGPSVRLWDLTTKAEQVPTGATGPTLGLEYDPLGHRVATALQDGTARLWDFRSSTGSSLVFDFRQSGPAGGIAFSPSGRHFAVGLGNGLVALLRTPGAPLQ